MNRPGVIQGFFPGVRSNRAVPLPAHLAALPAAGGTALPPYVLQRMERQFGTRFGDVRIHVGANAARLGALAFTSGSHIHFAPGQYNPATAQGQQMLAHELTLQSITEQPDVDRQPEGEVARTSLTRT